MVTMRLVFLLFAGLLAWPASAALGTTTTVRLLLSHESAKPGETVMAGVQLRMAPKWHTYWENGGDSGAPTTIGWTLPEGFTTGPILWPVPERYVAEGLVTYVYHDVITLLVPISIPATATPGSIDLKAKVSWFECNEQCLPGSAPVSAKLVIGAESKPSANAGSIEAAKKKLPTPKSANFARASWSGSGVGKMRSLVVEWTAAGGTAATKFDFYPHTDPKATISASNEVVSVNAGKVQLRKVVEKSENEWPTDISGVLIEQTADNTLVGAYEVQLPIEGSAGAAASDSGALAGEKKSLLVWLSFGFLGGLILNLMPCVLPIIALKIFGFVAQAHEAPGRVRKLGLIYGLGVLCSFLVLAGIVIAVQSAGRLASWGMQFGNPYFLTGMTVLVTLVALNLFGLFEITLGGGTMDAASGLASKEGPGGAFFNGVLATVLSTPCSAPFLAGALGFAFAQPPGIIVLMFLSIGVGLASPYVLLSFQPKWMKFLPKPGAWMERFKNAMGFPMLATAIWLLSILSRHYGNSGVLWVGIFLVFVALAAWTFGEFVQRGTKRRGLAAVLAVLFLASGYVFALEKQLNWRTPPAPNRSGKLATEPGGIEWLAWSPEAVAKARKEGRPVFVDFTADWCLTCKLNKASSIEIESVRAKLKAINAVSLLGDYTLVDPAITEELKRFGRAAVPLVLVYPKDASLPPVELPAALTPGIVLDALDKAAK